MKLEARAEEMRVEALRAIVAVKPIASLGFDPDWFERLPAWRCRGEESLGGIGLRLKDFPETKFQIEPEKDGRWSIFGSTVAHSGIRFTMFTVSGVPSRNLAKTLERLVAGAMQVKNKSPEQMSQASRNLKWTSAYFFFAVFFADFFFAVFLTGFAISSP